MWTIFMQFAHYLEREEPIPANCCSIFCRPTSLETQHFQALKTTKESNMLSLDWYLLRRLLLILYTFDLIQLIEGHGMAAHLHADNNQVSGSCGPSNVSVFSSSISDCLRVGAGWMKSNRLQLNSSKKQRLKSCGVQQAGPAYSTCVGMQCQSTALWLTRWGQFVTLAFTSTPTWAWEVAYSESCRAVLTYSAASCGRFAGIYRQPSSRHCVVIALVLSRLDYGNGRERRTGRPPPASLVRRLQSVLHAFAYGWSLIYVAPNASLTRLPVHTVCASRSASTLRSLCWRIQFFNGLHGVTESARPCVRFTGSALSPLCQHWSPGRACHHSNCLLMAFWQ